MKSSAIRHLAVSPRSTKLAAGFSERMVQIWNLSTRKKIIEFETTLSFGGWRLALDPAGGLCATAAWEGGKRGGIACYEAESGRLVWKRPDIERTQRLRFSADGKSLWSVPETGPTRSLDSAKGITLDTLPALADICISPYSDDCLLVRRKRDYQLGKNKRICIPRLKFAVLDAAFSPDSLTVSEAGGPVRCFRLSTGIECWRYVPRVTTHFVKLWFRKADQNFYGVLWEYHRGSFRTLVCLDGKTGESKDMCHLNSWEEEYCIALDSIVTSGGEMIALSDGRQSDGLSFPTKDYPDKHPDNTEPRTN
jgi:outer membrane protein assembly factor BamB